MSARFRTVAALSLAASALGAALHSGQAAAQAAAVEFRDPRQRMDDDFAKSYLEWTRETKYGSPLVDHLPLANGIPTPKSVLGYHIGAPKKLTYYADILKYYRALEAAAPNRVKVEHIGTSDEGRELVVVWISSDENMAKLAQNRANLARLADPPRIVRGAGARADQHDEAALPLHGRAPLGRDGPVGDDDGAGVSPGDGDVAVYLEHPQQRVRLDHSGG
jgi:hypothetical protein